MKIIEIFLTIFILTITISSFAQTEERNKISVGFQLNQVQNDFGLGLNLSSPIFNNSYELHLRSNLMFYEYVDKMEMIWEPYANILLGVSSVPYKINETIALYGEGGAIAILPSNKFSKRAVAFGGYGIFGFEFYFDEYYCFFLEAGGVGSSAIADKIPTKPIYSNGFLMSVGWKLKL